MRKNFPGYYRPSRQEFQALWDSATFAFDANVFLGLYGYSKQTRQALLGVIEAINDRLWMPHQFAAEYQRYRVKAIFEQVGHYRSVAAKLKSILNEHFKAQHRHPFVAKKSLNAFEQLCKELEKGEKEHESLLSNDPYFERISALFTERVGPEPTQETLAKMHDIARARYARKVPPGYSDQQKSEPESFGDFVGWQQILDYGAAKKAALILITDDQKEDWWRIHQERRIGPRPELIEEYLATCSEPFYMYTLEQFLRRAREYLGQQVRAAALDEVREISAARRVAETSVKPTRTEAQATEMKPDFAESAPKSEAPSNEEKESSVKPNDSE